MKMTHTRLLVSNFRACFVFYRDVMGFPVLWGDEHDTYANFGVDGHRIALFEREPMAEGIGTAPPKPRQEEHDDVCLVFAAADVDASYQSLLQKGVKTLNQPHDRKDWGIRCFHFRDPEGTLIEINQDLGLTSE